MEPNLYSRLNENFENIKRNSMVHYISLPQKKLISAKLLDVQMIEGVYINRSLNLPDDYYDFQQVTNEKQKFVQKQKRNSF